jgi:hypothetical protein
MPTATNESITPSRRSATRTIERKQAALERIRDTRPGNFASDADAIEWMKRQAAEALS